MPGHFLRLREPEKKKKRGRDIREDAILDAKTRGIPGNVNEVDQVRGVRGVGRSIRITHQLAIPMVGRD